jgi:hypothetical protein
MRANTKALCSSKVSFEAYMNGSSHVQAACSLSVNPLLRSVSWDTTTVLSRDPFVRGYFRQRGSSSPLSRSVCVSVDHEPNGACSEVFTGTMVVIR